ncbi:MAG: hypothetical protein AAF432_11740 [Planctomycetota bacterium]
MGIVRGIAGVIVGYIATIIVVFTGFTVLWMVMKAEGAFKTESWEVTTNWVIAGMVIGLVGALVGGIVCKLVAANSIAPKAFAGIVLVLGLLTAVATGAAYAAADEDGESDKAAFPAADVSMVDAMTNAEQPPLALWTNPFIGAVGILIGASLVGRKSGAAPMPASDG